MTAELRSEIAKLGQVVLVFQGGGALGAYQAGVFEALDEAGIQPDWVIGTSIGAINAALIAGNKPADRLPRLREFWRRMEQSAAATWLGGLPFYGPMAANALTMMSGVRNFFKVNPFAALGLSMAPEAAGFYSIAPLERTLAALIDTDVLNAGAMRLTVGAANVRTAQMHYFDSREAPLSTRHIIASGAPPPAFPAVRIDGELYWDGGILSNTPVEVVFDDHPRRSGLIFSVHIWHPHGCEPDSMVRVMSRQKDLQYSSRSMAQVARQRQIHRLRHVIAELAAKLPSDVAATNESRDLAAYGCRTPMHVVRLVAPAVLGEDQHKDIDFSPDGIAARWKAGYADTMATLRREPWRDPHDPLEGFILHEADAGALMPAA